MGIGALFGFAKAMLAFDLNMVETFFEGEADHLGALRARRSVGYQRQPHPQLFEAVERLVRTGKHPQLGFVDFVEAIGHRVADLGWWNRSSGSTRQPRESLRDNMAACFADTRAPVFVPRCV